MTGILLVNHMRKILLLTTVAVVAGGCGRSFTELDAIYKDELSVLDDLYNERDAALAELYRRFSEPGKKRLKAAMRQYDAEVALWTTKNQKTIDKWANEHGDDSTYVEDRMAFERKLNKPVEPSSDLQFHTAEEDEAYSREAKKISDRFASLIEEQEQKIEQAKARRDAAK